MNKNRRWFIVGICSLLFLVSMFYRVSNAVISPQLIDEFGLSSDELGLLTASFFYAFAFFQIPVGLLLDRFGARTIMTAFSVLGGIGDMVFARSTAINGLICGRILLGIGMSCNLMGSLKLFGQLFYVFYRSAHCCSTL
jgi:MFS family permease